MNIQLHGKDKCYQMALDNNHLPAELHTGSNIYVYNYCMLNERHQLSEEWHKLWLNDVGIRRKNINSKVCELNGEYLYCSFPYWRNYGHMTINAAGAFLLAKKLGFVQPTTKIIMPSRLRFHAEIKEIFGINSYECIDIADNVIYKVERLIYCDSYLGNYYHPEFIKLFEEVAEGIQGGPPVDIYITRKDNGTRVPRNDAEVIDYLRKKNFIVVDFATIPVREQISLVKRANIICAGHGASGANLIYRDEKQFKFMEYFMESCILAYNARMLFSKNVDYHGFVLPVIERSKVSRNYDVYEFDFELFEKAYFEPVFFFRRGMLDVKPQTGMDIYEQYITPLIK